MKKASSKRNIIPLLFYLLGVGMASALYFGIIEEQERVFSEQQFLQTLLVRQSVEEYLNGLIAQAEIRARYSFPEFAEGKRSRDSIDTLIRIERELNSEYLAYAYLEAPDRPIIVQCAAGADRPALESLIRKWTEESWNGWPAGSAPSKPDAAVAAVSPESRLMGLVFPVLAEGGLRGALAVVVDLAPLIDRMIVPMRSVGSGAGLLLEGGGTVLHDPETRNIGRSIAADLHGDCPDRLRVDRRLLAEPSGRDAYRVGDRRTLVAWHAAEAGGLRLVVAMEAPDGEVRAAASWRTLRLLLSAALALVLVCGTVALFLARQITARRKAEEERTRLEARMRRFQKLESLGSLAGGIAHDFNNMLMAIQGNAELARQDLPQESPTRLALVEIETVTRRASQLSAQMLAYAGKGRKATEPLALSKTIHGMDAILRASVSRKATLRYGLEENLPLVAADPAQIRQVVLNLVVNASEALEEKEGTIRISTGSLPCDRQALSRGRTGEDLPEGLYAYLEVSDTGCGMDAAAEDRIFDPFFSTKFAGRGLGLPAVLGIVRAHRGTILVDSAPGRGTTVRVLLPAAGDAVEAPEADPAPRRESWRGSGTVLLVDDEAPVRRLCRRMLERIGFRVLEAPDGREALEIYGKRGADIRCVILDMAMPVMDGGETLEALRRVDAGVRVILSSGYDSRELSGPGARAGAAAFIQKPYGMDGLRDALRAVLDGAPRPA